VAKCVADPVTGAEVLNHPAVRAWAQVWPGPARPAAVQRLQKKRKGQVYRLEGAGPGGAAVIAKRSSRDRIAGERRVYERVLPTLPVPVVRYFGSVDEGDSEGAWLFVEDAGGEPYSPQRAEHRALAGRWLSRLHTLAAGPAANAGLPDRGPGYYRGQLRSARATLLAHLANPALPADAVALMRAVIGQCDVADANWADVETWCEPLPLTLVHADFAPKNMRVRRGRAGDILLPFDWGSAGRGPPAADLSQAGPGDVWDYWAGPDLATYAEAARGVWPELGAADLQRLAAVGKVLRSLVCVNLEAPSFAFDWVERAVQDLRVYQAAMADAIRAAGWDG